MEYIYNMFNCWTVLLAAVSIAALYVAMTGLNEGRIDRLERSHPKTYRDFAGKLRKRTRRQWAVISALIGMVAVVGMVYNIPKRTREIEMEDALVKLAGVVNSITERQFGERCAFNGIAVDSAWIESDTFPCITIGNTRIWSKGTAQVNHSAVAIRRAFVLGTLNDDKSISTRAEIDFESVLPGINNNFPYTKTEMSTAEITALADALTR